MSHDDDWIDPIEWTGEELARLKALAAERTPPTALKRRTVASLRRRALLEPKSAIGPRTALWLAAAASAVFAAGAMAGYAVATRRASVPAVQSVAATRALVRAETSDAAQKPARQIIWF